MVTNIAGHQMAHNIQWLLETPGHSYGRDLGHTGIFLSFKN